MKKTIEELQKEIQTATENKQWDEIAKLQKQIKKLDSTTSEENSDLFKKRVQALSDAMFKLDKDYFYIRKSGDIVGKKNIDFILDPIITNDDNSKNIGIFQYWKKNAPVFRGVDYMPINEMFIKREDGEYINTFKGFPYDINKMRKYIPQDDGLNDDFVTVQPHESEILHFIFSNICSENQAACDFLLQYLSQLLHDPCEKHALTPVFQGSQGTGKTSFFRLLKKIFGENNVYSAEPTDIDSKFNSALANRLIIFADEATFSGDIRQVNRLKNLTGSDIIRIEKKGLEPYSIHNYARLMIATNDDWSSPTEFDNRRYVTILTTNSGKVDWDKLNAEINDKTAVARFMDFILKIDYKKCDFHPQRAPVFFEEANRNTKMMTALKLDPVGAWLMDDDIDDTDSVHSLIKKEGFIPSQTAYNLFKAWLENNSTSYSREITHCKFSIDMQKNGFKKSSKKMNGITIRIFEKP